MKILVPMPYDLTCLAHGRNLRIVNLLRELHRLCNVTCLVSDESIAAAARQWLQLPIQTAPPLSETASADRLLGACDWPVRRAIAFHGYNPALLAAVVSRAAAYDIVLGFDVPSLVYLLAAREIDARPRPRVICDVIDDPWLNWKSWPVLRRLAPSGLKAGISTHLLRQRVLPRLDALVAVGPLDADMLATATHRTVEVVPNGVVLSALDLRRQEREPLAVFTGAMNFPPNESAAQSLIRRIWPGVLQRLASSQGLQSGRPPQLAIVGADPSPKLRRLGESAGVLITGRVDDVSAWLRRAQVALAPMVNGCGIKNKVLEACASGCPVVSTSLGAAGIPCGVANGVLVADSVQHFADETARLLTDWSAARRLGASARAMVTREFTWGRSAERLLQTLERLLRFPAFRMAGSRASDRDSEEALAHAAS
jgi:glycosyltransferase involved in cell wall biosynthesis